MTFTMCLDIVNEQRVFFSSPWTSIQTRIYLPRATRVCASSVAKYINNIQSLIGSSSSNAEDGDHTNWGMSGLKVANNGGQAWASNNEEFDGPISLQKDIMLDDIFEEYQQLLKADDHGQLDSFVESLLA
jgi:myb proto-oncogene protein